MYTLSKLKNNIRFLVAPSSGTETVTLMVLVKVGSRYESAGLEGVAHFIEHMLFKGTTNYPNTQILSRELDAIGAEFNAFTGKEYTAYYVKSSVRHVEKITDILYEMIGESLMKADDMEKEKKVIVEEIKMYEENPIMHNSDFFEAVMHEGHQLGVDIAGTKESVMGYKQADVIEFMKNHYTSDSVVLCVAGNVEGDVLDIITKRFEDLELNLSQNANVTPYTKQELNSPRVEIQQRDIEQTQLSLGFFALPYGHPDMPVLQVLNVLLGGNMSSRLFHSIREEKGLCYSISSRIHRYSDVGVLRISAGLDKERIELALKAIKAECDDVRNHGVKVDEVQRAKDFLEGKLSIMLEDSFEVGLYYGMQELRHNKIIEPKEKVERIMAVTPEQVSEMAKLLNTSTSTLTLIGPYTDTKIFEDILK